MSVKPYVVATVMALIAAPFALSGGAVATSIHTGDDTEALHTRYCPELATQLSRAKFDYTCAWSPGTTRNVKAVVENPRQIGMGQLDVFAHEAVKFANPAILTQIRSDDMRQCLFAVSRHRDLQTYGELAARAAKLRFILPAPDSDSTATFRLLQQIDLPGLGATKNVQHASSALDAVRAALTSDDGVAFFVQFPDPEDRTFRLVRELGGHFVPIIDREILRQQIAGQKTYFAQETQVANADWLEAGQKVVTTCTPSVVFTGSSASISDEQGRRDHEDLIATVRALRPEALLPQESNFARALKRTKEISATSAEQLVKASEQAREKAKPYLDSAKEAADKAYEAARPAYERARDYGLKAYERAREELKELMAPKTEPEAAPIQPSPPTEAPKQ